MGLYGTAFIAASLPVQVLLRLQAQLQPRRLQSVRCKQNGAAMASRKIRERDLSLEDGIFEDSIHQRPNLHLGKAEQGLKNQNGVGCVLNQRCTHRLHTWVLAFQSELRRGAAYFRTRLAESALSILRYSTAHEHVQALAQTIAEPPLKNKKGL